MEPLFLQILGVILNERKRRRRQKPHQGSPNQETEAVFESLRKIVRKGRSLVAQSPTSPENCKKSTIEANWKQKTNQVEMGFLPGIHGNATYSLDDSQAYHQFY